MAAPWKTALVTGASSGIGAAFARLLAARGVDLVITARDTTRLKALATEVRDRNGVEVQVLTADLAKTAGVSKVAARLTDGEAAPIDLLVNNAGFGSHGRLWELPVEGEVGQVQVNVLALVRLTHAALGPMVERRRGAVLNVSSMAGEQAVPQNATYGATKAFVTTFSEAVHEEVKGTGATVTALLPGWTRTEFQERAGFEEARKLPEVLWMEADQVAEEALAATEAGRAVVVPGAANKVVTATAGVVPRGLKRRVVSLIADRF